MTLAKAEQVLRDMMRWGLDGSPPPQSPEELAAISVAIEAIEDAERLAQIIAAAKELLSVDGGAGSECYDALRLWGARNALKKALSGEVKEETSWQRPA